ncbi:MAG: 4Fe-4S dicluster domain-containing protein [Candidatus Heimdallarchaeaceae archaeon]
MSVIEKIKKFIFIKIGIPRFEKIIELEDSLVEKEGSISFSEKSPVRFDIPNEFARREGIDVPLTSKTMTYILSSVKNMKRAIIDLKGNKKDSRNAIEESEFIELESFIKFIKSLKISGIGYTKVPREYIFFKKAVAYENAIVLAMNMDKEKISTAPSKKALKNIWQTYDGLGVAANKIARYLRKKGFASHASHPLGGIVLYPRLAEKAGMGAFGKAGILITPINGPTLRLAAVYTNIENLPLNEGNEHLWVRDFCEQCNKCIKACPPGAIYKEAIEHDSGRVTHIDNEKCFPYFGNNFACTICISVCPFQMTSYDKVKERFEKK